MQKVPFYLLWLLIFSIPWQNVVTLPGLGTITRLIGFASVGLAIIYVIIKKRIKEPSLFLIFSTLFVVWSFVSVLWSINPAATISRTITNVQLLAMIWLMWELCDSREEVFSIMQAYVFGGFVSIIDMLITFTVTTDEFFRITTTGFNQNDIATTLALGIPIAWYLYIRKQKGVVAWVNISYIPLSLFSIVLTASRGGLLVACAGLILIPLTTFDLQRRSRYIINMLLIIIVFLSVIYLPTLYPMLEKNIERLQGTTTEILEGTLTHRTVIWKAGIKVYKNYPILGVGTGAFRYAVVGTPVDPLYSRPDLFAEPEMTSHNTFLSILVETGIMGFIILIIILYVILIPVLFTDPVTRKFYLILFISLIVGLIPLGWEYSKVTWFVFSLFTLNLAYVLEGSKVKIRKRLL